MEKMVKKRHMRYIGGTLIPTIGHSLTIQFNVSDIVIIKIRNSCNLHKNEAQLSKPMISLLKCDV